MVARRSTCGSGRTPTLTRMIELGASDWRAYANRGFVYFSLKRYRDAIADFKQFIQPRLEHSVKSGKTDIFYETAIGAAVAESEVKISAVMFKDNWLEIDTPEDLERAKKLWK